MVVAINQLREKKKKQCKIFLLALSVTENIPFLHSMFFSRFLFTEISAFTFHLCFVLNVKRARVNWLRAVRVKGCACAYVGVYIFLSLAL